MTPMGWETKNRGKLILASIFFLSQVFFTNAFAGGEKVHTGSVSDINEQMIKINLALPDDTRSIAAATTFFLPREYEPKTAVDNKTTTLFEFYFQYPTKQPYPKARNIVPAKDLVRVIVRRYESRKQMRSESTVRRIKTDSSNNYVQLQNAEKGTEAYRHEIGEAKKFMTIKIFRDSRSNPIVAQDSGLAIVDVNRALNDYIELNYQIKKSLASDLENVDKAVVELTESFQRN